jgi:hypothetical protein
MWRLIVILFLSLFFIDCLLSQEGILEGRALSWCRLLRVNENMMILYSGTACPFSHRCRIVLFEKGMDFEIKDI